MPLLERLQGVVDILDDSNMELESPRSGESGYIPSPPQMLAEAVVGLLAHADISKVSLDLGCGNGGWMLLAAAAGFASHGVEINPFLVSHLQRNYERAIAAGLIDPATPCSWTIGDMIPVRLSAQYGEFRRLHKAQERTMPIAAVREDSYARLPVDPSTADIVYCWAWPTQSRFVFNMLQDCAKGDALFVLPSYEEYAASTDKAEENALHLARLCGMGKVYVGRRA